MEASRKGQKRVDLNRSARVTEGLERGGRKKGGKERSQGYLLLLWDTSPLWNEGQVRIREGHVHARDHHGSGWGGTDSSSPAGCFHIHLSLFIKMTVLILELPGNFWGANCLQAGRGRTILEFPVQLLEQGGVGRRSCGEVEPCGAGLVSSGEGRGNRA